VVVEPSTAGRGLEGVDADGIAVLGVVGAGAMGRGIVQVAAQAGLSVRLFDQSAAASAQAIDRVRETLERLVARGTLCAAEAAAALARIEVVASLQGLAGCDLVVEAIVERLDAKQQLLGELEPIVGDAALLASNTSSLSITQLAAACAQPGRVVGWHFFNPVPLMRIVEVIAGLHTVPSAVERLCGLSTRMGHRAVVARDTPGFIVNHAGRGYGTEALKLLQEGVAEPAQIDLILREVAGFRLGPFELLDLTGLDVSHPVMESIYRQFYDDPRYRPSYLAAQRLAGGRLGRKSGAGFYAYPASDSSSPAPAPAAAAPAPATPAPASGASQVRFRTDPRDGARAEAVADYLRAVGARVADVGSAAADDIVVLAPLGRDATSGCVSGGHDPARTVAIDALLPIGVGQTRRRVVMGTPLTQADALAAARQAFGADGAAVSVIADSPGFVVQRVLAMIVAIACEMAAQGIGTPQDIDEAVRLGLGYPCGPLAWGGQIGAAALDEVLAGLFASLGDPRYRPSLWLRRCALLGVSPLALRAGAAPG